MTWFSPVGIGSIRAAIAQIASLRLGRGGGSDAADGLFEHVLPTTFETRIQVSSASGPLHRRPPSPGRWWHPDRAGRRPAPSGWRGSWLRSKRLVASVRDCRPSKASHRTDWFRGSFVDGRAETSAINAASICPARTLAVSLAAVNRQG
jgi:hypothetical protein